MPSRRRYVRISFWCTAMAFMLAFAVEAASLLIGHNFHTVVPGRVYRCAQPYGDELQRDIDKYGIKTVINLRGCNAAADWYLNESRATAANGISQEDLTFSSGRLPDPWELRRLLDVLDNAEYPIVIHCRRGVDRTGLTSAAIALLYEHATIAEARSQLSYRHAHFPWGRTEAMLRFFDLYEQWLSRMNVTHSSAAFREYLEHGYCPGPARGRIEALAPVELTAGRAGVVRLRATNTSEFDWHFRATTGAKIHLRYRIFDEAGTELQSDCAGMFEATIAPGRDVVMSLPINRLPTPGKYTLRADLLDGPLVAFMQVGGDEFVMELTAQ